MKRRKSESRQWWHQICPYLIFIIAFKYSLCLKNNNINNVLVFIRFAIASSNVLTKKTANSNVLQKRERLLNKYEQII